MKPASMFALLEGCTSLMSIVSVLIAIAHHTYVATQTQRIDELDDEALSALRWRSMLQHALVSIAIITVVGSRSVDLGDRWLDGRLRGYSIAAAMFTTLVYSGFLAASLYDYNVISTELRRRQPGDDGEG